MLKLSDSALSKDLFPSDYHCLGDNDNRPIKWLPVEAIVNNKYSRASDVVSYFNYFYKFEISKSLFLTLFSGLLVFLCGNA